MEYLSVPSRSAVVEGEVAVGRPDHSWRHSAVGEQVPSKPQAVLGAEQPERILHLGEAVEVELDRSKKSPAEAGVEEAATMPLKSLTQQMVVEVQEAFFTLPEQQEVAEQMG